MASETDRNSPFGEGTSRQNVPNLRLSDCKCPICMCVLIEPVRMPCKHELCMPCFKKNVEEANFTCPMCRLRISNWARRCARENTLVDRGRWRQIRRAFPDQCRRRLEGEEDDEHDEEELLDILPIKRLCEPGAIREEYNEAIEKLKRERQQMEEIEIKKSEEYIAWLQREEVRLYEEHQNETERQQKLDEELAWKISQGDKALKDEVRAQMLHQQAVKDEEYARQLQNEISKTQGPSSVSSPPSTTTKVVSKKTSRNSSRTSNSSASSSVKSHRIDVFLSPTAKPPSPSSRSSSKASSKAANNSGPSPVPSVSSQRASSSSWASCVSLDLNKPSTSNGEGAEPILFGDPPWGDRSSSDCILEIVGDSSSPVISYRSPSSDSGSSRSLKGSLLGGEFVLDPTVNPREGSKEVASKKASAFESVEKSSSESETGETASASISRKRSDSMTSTDSISPELNHFRPIDVSPRTSHRRLSNGKKDLPKIIHTTPRNLTTNMTEDGSEQDRSLPPLVKAKFESLIKEKRKKLNETSKATMTGRANRESTSTLMRQELNKRLHRKPSGNRNKVFVSPPRKQSTKPEKSPLAGETPKARFFRQLESKKPVREEELDFGERVLKQDAKQITANQQDNGDVIMLDLVNLKAKANTSNGAENGTEFEKPVLVNGKLKHANFEHEATNKETDIDNRGKRKSCSPKAQNKRQKLENKSPGITAREVSSGGDNEKSSVKKSPGKVYRMRANRPQPKQSSIKQLFKDSPASEQDYSVSPKRRKVPSGGGSPLPMLIQSPHSSNLKSDHRKEKNQENVSSCETEQSRVDVATPDKGILMDATYGSNREQKWDSDKLVDKTKHVPPGDAKSNGKSPEIRSDFVGKAKTKLKNTSPSPGGNHQRDQRSPTLNRTPSKTRRNTIWKYMELVGEEEQRIKQEEEDRKLALKLQKEFDRQERRRMLMVDRSQGSDAAYELRGRSLQSAKKKPLVDEVDSDDDIFT